MSQKNNKTPAKQAQYSYSERAAALVNSDYSLEEMVCHAALDYSYATVNSVFADAYGGVTFFKDELIRLAKQWEADKCAGKDSNNKGVNE